MISLAPVILGVFILFAVLPDIAANYSATGWPKASGIISESKTTGIFSLYRKESYISYRYEVNGRTFTGNRIYFGGGSASGYYRGQAIDVYYNPNNHNEAILEIGLRSENLFVLMLGSGLVIVGRLLWKRLA